ncbi:Di-copper centre-containing protein [Gigaspora margarita]|uniref:Di-copper centre-containing protein n=1 Tax=Gigaspora margarita TaxID=4874 RepID=A0A8H4AZ35_GIGMA|nr:Di-copper centre-containing protein [Gigaspora margarita]
MLSTRVPVYNACYKEGNKDLLNCTKTLENKSKRTFAYEMKQERDIKRSSDPLEKELSYHGLVYMPKINKRNPQPLIKKKHVFERANTDTNAQNLESRILIPNTTTEDASESIESQLARLNHIIKNPPPAKLNPNGWPDKDVYDPELDKIFWWRNDHVLNEFHEHWHLVIVRGDDNTRKNRDGEIFIHTHRQLLARYDADRLCVGLEKVTPLPDLVSPIPDPFYPHPYLFAKWNNTRVHFTARPANQTLNDIVEIINGKVSVYTISELEEERQSLIEWVDGGTNIKHPIPLKRIDSDASILGLDAALHFHLIGHKVLSRIMNPYTINYPLGVLTGPRAGIRDPLFLKWHRYVDNIFLRWQNYLGPSDFHYDAPNVTIRTTDIILSFTDVLLKVYPDGQKDEWSEFGKKTFGGSNFDVDFTNRPIVTNEFHTKMKYREYVWREDLFDKENISYVFPRDWHYFLRVTNEVNITSIITFRIFIVPEVFSDSIVHWIELDKFKTILKTLEKTVIVREVDKSIIIRKPAQKTESQFDESQIISSLQKTNSGLTAQALSEKLFCHCGWPYHMILPRGTKGEGTKFKMIVFISDGTNDMVPLYDQCGSTVLCGAKKWTDKFPDIRPMGYPFNRPFKNGSYEKTFKGLHNVAIKGIAIIWKDDDFSEF